MTTNYHVENAELTVRFLQSVLVQHGLMDDASRLENVQVDSPEVARTAFDVVSQLKMANGTPPGVRESRRLTLERLRLASHAAA